MNYSELRSRLKSVCDAVCDRREPLFVRRRDGGDVVILSKQDFDALEESAWLLRSPANARRLFDAMGGPAPERQTFESVAELKDALGI